jgi:sortase A
MAPRAGYDAIVLAGAEGAPLAFGPGQVEGTPLPGSTGNAVFAGHRDTQFRFLREVGLGDELIVETPDRERHHFFVVDTRVIHENDTSVLEPTGESTLTLVTCYPFDARWAGGPLRYVVRAREGGAGNGDLRAAQ